MKDKLGRSQNQGEQPAHPFQGVNAQVFDIQALFLIEAVPVFDPAPQAPVAVDGNGVRFDLEGDIGE